MPFDVFAHDGFPFAVFDGFRAMCPCTKGFRSMCSLAMDSRSLRSTDSVRCVRARRIPSDAFVHDGFRPNRSRNHGFRPIPKNQN